MSVLTVDWVKHHATYKPDYTAMVDLASGRKYSYADMHERVGRMAGYLKSKGIKKGDRVAYLMLNSTDLMEVIFGCWRIGAVCLALNFRLTPPEIGFILDNSETSLVFVDKVFEPLAKALEGKTPVKEWIVSDCMGGDSEYETAMAGAELIYDMVDQTMDEQCMLMYSSGTTGTPKGVIITHNMMYFAPAAGTRDANSNANAIALANMPLFHIGAIITTGCNVIWAGATIIMLRMFDPEATLDAINNPELGVSTLFMVPAAYNVMKAHPKMETTDFSRIKIALCGGASVPAALVDAWLEHGVAIQNGYGMTETTGAGGLLAKEDVRRKPGSSGKSLIHATIKIVDESGNECAPNVSGEIYFKGATITPGYWRRPDANAESFVDGWFKSGDIARKDEEGFIYIEDRIKDMYISGGENVYPAEVENLLYRMPQIMEVAIIGVEDSKFGETGCVIAVTKPDCELCLEDIHAHIGDQVAKYKWPNHLHMMKELPRNATGKVLKFELRKTVPGLLDLK